MQNHDLSPDDAELQVFIREFGSRLNRVDCPTVDELRAHRWGMLLGPRQAEVDQHLALCQTCREEWSVLVGPQLAADLAGESLTERVRGALTRIVAELRSTSLDLRPALRGDAPAEQVFDVPKLDWQVSVQVSPTDRGYSVAGQVLGVPPDVETAGFASLLRDGRLVAESPVDETGWFNLRVADAGVYQIWIEDDERRIQLTDVHIGDAGSSPTSG